ncbi:MAG: MoxR family ATPase [Saprospiraceae bacterium]|nr:MoxR family ATPase [Saprospiraceae bacterium]
MLHTDIEELNSRVYQSSAFITRLTEATSNIIVGQETMIERLLIGLLTKGHVLLEGLPGLAKTLAIKTLANLVNGKFSRIQFTPDLLPADIVGTMIYNPAQNKFTVKTGPIFANFILADEINRAPAKVQSALLEAMQEKQVTIGEETFRLEEPFLVMATQNPIEQEGTYPLPEAQLDRFMLKVTIGYPSKEEELNIIRRHMDQSIDQTQSPVATTEEILQARALLKSVYIDPTLEGYLLDIVFATRYIKAAGLPDLEPMIQYGASPRASINLALAAKAMAFIRRRAYVIPDDIRAIAMDVLRHRIGITYEAEAEGISREAIITSILNTVQVP